MDIVISIVGAVLLIYLGVVGAQMIWRVFSFMTRRESRSMDDEHLERCCVECGYDLRASGLTCPECGAANVDRRRYLKSLSSEWPADEIVLRTVESDELAELLLSTSDAFEAELLREQLVARGIPCKIEESRIGTYVPGQRSSVFARVMVYTRDLEAARDYLATIQDKATDFLESNQDPDESRIKSYD